MGCRIWHTEFRPYIDKRHDYRQEHYKRLRRNPQTAAVMPTSCTRAALNDCRQGIGRFAPVAGRRFHRRAEASFSAQFHGSGESQL
jgi:hypothetical protein